MIPIIKSNVERAAFLQKLVVRGSLDTGDYAIATKKIVEDVRTRGDEALFEYTQKWDSKTVTPDTVKVSRDEMKAGFMRLDPQLREAMTLSAQRIKAFHEKQKQNTWIDLKENGEILGQRVLPVESVGIYVPGGKAAYPSSVLMNAIPATVAGVSRIVMVTPLSQSMGSATNVPDNVLGAAYLAGIEELYTIGGAQAIAALAFGTETIPKVDKIVGPGNIYVALAKREVYGYVSIDSIAGPSEILVIADDTANPTYVAADLLSQAEHDELASSILITDSSALAEKVVVALQKLYEELPRQEILQSSLQNYSAIILVENLSEAAALSNQIAPEHLELATADPFGLLAEIKNAGAVFLGHYTPEPVGDYMAGPNHVLPTSGTARFFSPLGVDDFVKKSSILSFSPQALRAIGEEVVTFAESESLYAHALSVKIRLKEGE
ncbi:MAG: histidinol dehydrogenase [Cellulosilyticaceae bacterium]